MDVAAELGLWSQCFQTAEDIIHLGLHDMLQRSLYSKESAYYKNRSVFLSQTSRFYEKLARVQPFVFPMTLPLYKRYA
jgi:sporulation-control protein spo0M